MHKAKTKFLSGKRCLVNLENKPMQSSAWFKVLRRIDRIFHNTRIKLVDKVNTANKTKILLLKKKVDKTKKSSFSICLYKIRLTWAQEIILFDLKIRNLCANDWILDCVFIKFLGVLQINANKKL